MSTGAAKPLKKHRSAALTAVLSITIFCATTRPTNYLGAHCTSVLGASSTSTTSLKMRKRAYVYTLYFALMSHYHCRNFGLIKAYIKVYINAQSMDRCSCCVKNNNLNAKHYIAIETLNVIYKYTKSYITL